MNRFLLPIIALLTVVLGAPVFGAAAATFDISAMTAGEKVGKVIETSCTTVAALQQCDFKGDPSKARIVQVQGTQDWYYATTSGGTGKQIKVTAGQTINIPVPSNQTISIYVQRVSADGVLDAWLVQ